LWIYIFDSWTWVYTTICVVWWLQTRHWNMMKIGEGCYLRDSWDGFPSHVRWSIIIQWVVGRLVVFHWTTMVSEQAENDIIRLYPLFTVSMTLWCHPTWLVGRSTESQPCVLVSLVVSYVMAVPQ
jgi:hypothetical protein